MKYRVISVEEAMSSSNRWKNPANGATWMMPAMA